MAGISNSSVPAAQFSESRLRSLLQSMTDLVFVLDDRRIFTEYHQMPDRGLYVPAEDFIGRSIYQIEFPQPALMRLEAAIAAVETSGAPQTADYALPLPDGTAHFEARVTRIVDHAGGHAGVTVVARDVTERYKAEARRHELEKQLQDSRRAEALGLLAAGVADECDNLLTAIIGNLEIVADQLPSDDPVAEPLREAITASERAAAISRRMLLLSGHGTFTEEPVDLAVLLTRAVRDLRPTLPVGVTLHSHLPGDLPLVKGDPEQIACLVQALLENALDASSGSEAAIEVRGGTSELDEPALRDTVPPGAMRPGRLVWFEVADSGAGMTSEAVGRMFDPFYTTRGAGRGLDLAVAMGVVRAHNGAFIVDSAPGQGTRVRVLLHPLSQVDQPVR